MRKQRIKGALAAVVALSFVAAACGDDEESSSTTAAPPRGHHAGLPHRDTMEATDAPHQRGVCRAHPGEAAAAVGHAGQFAGYYAAVEEGFYEAMCLDVTILEGAVDITPQTVLANGDADFAISWVPKALASREAVPTS
jgi:NitT/TauT family transport system substrate-binding protein